MTVVSSIQINRSSLSYDTLSELEVEEIRLQVESFLNGTLSDIEVQVQYSCITLL